MMKQQSKPTPNDSNHLPAHLIAPEARNFAHHKRVGDYANGLLKLLSGKQKNKALE